MATSDHLSGRDVFKNSYKYHKGIKRAFSPAKSGVVLPMPMLYKRLF